MYFTTLNTITIISEQYNTQIINKDLCLFSNIFLIILCFRHSRPNTNRTISHFPGQYFVNVNGYVSARASSCIYWGQPHKISISVPVVWSNGRVYAATKCPAELNRLEDITSTALNYFTPFPSCICILTCPLYFSLITLKVLSISF